MEFLKKNRILIISSIVGAIGGFLYWKYVGCLSGTCPIKSVWYLSTLFGTVLGYLAGSLFNDLFIKIRNKKNQNKDSAIS